MGDHSWVQVAFAPSQDLFNNSVQLSLATDGKEIANFCVTAGLGSGLLAYRHTWLKVLAVSKARNPTIC